MKEFLDKYGRDLASADGANSVSGSEEDLQPTFQELLLVGAAQLVGETDEGDSTPMLIEEAFDRTGIRLRDQSNGREIIPNLGEMGLFLRQAMQAGACVDMPAPGDIVIWRYNESRLHWSGVVETVGATDIGVFMSHQAPHGSEGEYERRVVGRRGINNAWRVVGFIRL